MRTTDEVAAALDYNFRPGDSVMTIGGHRHRIRGVVVAVLDDGFTIKVMWSPVGGPPCFFTHWNWDLTHA